MFDRRFFAEAVALVVLAAFCGAVANGLAARERKLAWVGDYPNATTVPQKAAPAPAPAASTTPEVEPVVADTAVPDSPEPPVAPTVTPQGALPPEIPTPVAATSSPEPIPAPEPPVTARKQFLPTPDQTSADITNDDARQLFDDGAVFLDARRTSVYNEGHIQGARNMAVWEADVDNKVFALFDELTDQQQPIVVYCTGGNCEDSHMLAQKLWGIGYENVLVYTDGFPGWQSINGPVTRGPNP